MKDFFVDLHCHSTMRAFQTRPMGPEKNLWECTQNDTIDTPFGRWVQKQTKAISKQSQSNFYKCIKGNTRVVFDSLYPIERGFINFRKITELIIGKKASKTIVVTSSGISLEQFGNYKKSFNYFKELNEQYQLLAKNQGASPCGKYQYKLVNNYNELEESLSSCNKTINVIVTIEGAHALGVGTRYSERMSEEELKQILSKNIRAIKQWDHPPFFVTFSHHFWNQLCGHSPTFSLPTKISCNQSKGLGSGFTELGWFVLDELLSGKNGKRILIDTRHMSVRARKQYFDYVSNYNKLNPDNKVPLISSHSAVNGFKTMDLKKERKTLKGNFYCSSRLNLSAEEVIAIHHSRGIAGIILDKTRHCDTRKLKHINKQKTPDEKKHIFLKLILDNIFFCIEAVNAKSAWDSLALGTDFDGVITHFDFYRDTSSLPELKEDLIDFLNRYKYRYELWFGYSPEEIIHKLFTQNAMDFLKRNFR
jgi:microsomal dipeptidase-like Zn-dependent dipeptidase